MSLKQSDSVLSLFSFRIPRMSRPILTSFMRSLLLRERCLRRDSPGKNHFCEFFGGFGQEGQKRDAFYQSKKSRYRPPCSHGPLTEE